jgi:hypothetical protein
MTPQNSDSEVARVQSAIQEALKNLALDALSSYKMGRQMAYWSCEGEPELHSEDLTGKTEEAIHTYLAAKKAVQVSMVVTTKEDLEAHKLSAQVVVRTQTLGYRVTAPLVQTADGAWVALSERCVVELQ